MKIAVEGCAHGELENIYKTILNIEKEQNFKVDLLLCCGDFQSTRNLADLQTMAVPAKYQDMGTFYKYYSGELVAPMLTVFIGGNHEASNYLQELPYGGWVAPNIYYLGYAGMVRIGDLRIGGISGIYKGHDFLKGRYEFSPYSPESIRSVYHVRQIDVFRLKQLSDDIDVFLSHDWPRGIYNYGNKHQLVRFKPHFRDEVDNNQLGSRPCEDLLHTLKPTMWFAAHLHCQFAAVVPHESDDYETEADNDEADASATEFSTKGRFTKFLALDKCLPKRRFLQILDIPPNEDQVEPKRDSKGILELEYDLEWLTILNLTNHLLSIKKSNYYMPGPHGYNRSDVGEERYKFTPTPDELEVVRKKFNNDLSIPQNFCYTVPAFDPKQINRSTYIPQPKPQINPQTTQFCDTLGIDDPVSLALVINGHELYHSPILNSSTASLNESSTSLTSELNLSAMRFDVSTSSESSPGQRKGNISLNLPRPIAEQEDTAPLVTPLKKHNRSNPDELELSNSSTESNHIKNNELSISPTKEAIITTETVNVASDNTETSIPNTPTKKFKRRNQDLYTEKEEDEIQSC